MSRYQFTLRSLFIDTSLMALVGSCALLLTDSASKLVCVVFGTAVIVAARASTPVSNAIGLIAGLSSAVGLALPLAYVTHRSGFWDAFFAAFPLGFFMLVVWFAAIRCVAFVQRGLESLSVRWRTAAFRSRRDAS